MTVLRQLHLEPQTGAALVVKRGQRLEIVDPEGEQVSDLVSFAEADRREWLSSGRTIDYANTIYLTAGHTLYSNRSRPMWTMIEDTVGRHDFLLTPCSKDTFRIIYGDKDPHRGCFGNLAAALAPYGVTDDMIPTAFNCFMNVPVDGETGLLRVDPPLSKPGDRIVFEARMDLVIGLTACSALQSNNGSFKPIHWQVD